MIFSFDHDAGAWRVIGTGTVSSDGLLIESDPGVGILAPGWHTTWGGCPGSGGGAAGGGKANRNPGDPVDPNDPDKPDPCENLWKHAANKGIQCDIALALSGVNFVPLVGCGVSAAQGAIGTIADCIFDPDSCTTKTILTNTAFTLLGCVPGIGGAISTVNTCKDAGDAISIALNCQLASPSSSNPPGEGYGDSLNDYVEMANAANDLFAAGLGDDVWKNTPADELPKLHDIVDKIEEAVDPFGEGGEMITPDERAELDEMPKPSHFGPDDLDDSLDRLNDWTNGDLTPEEFGIPEIEAAAATMLVVFSQQSSIGWFGVYNDIRNISKDISDFQDEQVELSGIPVASNDILYSVRDIVSGFEVKGKLPNGIFEDLILAPNTVYSVEYLDPLTLETGFAVFESGLSGEPVKIPKAFFTADDVDSDGDGLSDEAERVIGTNPNNVDTDNDGIDDFTEFTTDGLDPLDDRGFPTGIISSIPVGGQAVEVIVEDLPDAGLTALIAKTGGLAIVDVNEFSNPIVLGQLDLTLGVTDVAFDRVLNMAVLSGGGLHLVDVSDPMLPRLLQTINANASQVEVADGIAFVASGGSVVSYDLLTGTMFAELAISAGSITSLALGGDMLYAMDNQNAFHSILIENIQLTLLDTLQLTNMGGGKISLGDGVVYAGALPSYFRGGYLTIDVSDPANMVLISGSSVESPFTNIGRHLVDNGSGTGLLIGGSALDLMDTRDPNNTGGFLNRVTLPEFPWSVTIGSGIAFVADGLAGLITVNYLGFDTNGVAPIVSMDALTQLDVDLGTAGIQLFEGSNIPIRLSVTDDVQVSRVELLVDGEVVASDVSFPWQLRTLMPTITSGVTQLRLQVRALDTGGNVGLSSEVVVNIFPDTSAPMLEYAIPAEGGEFGQNFNTMQFGFSETMDVDTLISDHFQLIDTAAPGAPIELEMSLIRSLDTVIQLQYPTLIPGDYQMILKASLITDFSGNPLGVEDQVFPFTIIGSSASFVNKAGGSWQDANNWFEGLLPASGDSVFLDVDPGAVVVFSELNPSTSFSTGDIKDLPGLVGQIIGSEDAVSTYLKSELPDLARGQLEIFDEFGGDPNPIEFHTLDLLNGILGDGSFYNTLRFDGVSLRVETFQLLSENPQTSADLKLLNRMLLEDVYPLYLPINPIGGGTRVGNITGVGILEIKAGQLAVDGIVRLDGQVIMSGGTLTNATILPRIIGGVNIGSEVDVVTQAVRSGVFNNVTIEGIAELPRRIDVENGITINGEITIFSGGSLYFLSDDSAIKGTGSIVFDATTVHSLPRIQVPDTGSLTIESGITLEGGYAYIGAGNYPGTLVNKGTIRANLTGRTIGIQMLGGSFTNQGILEAIDGGVISAGGGSFSNAGALNALTGGTITIDELAGDLGTFSMDADSLINLGGTFVLSEFQTWLNGAGTIGLLGTLDLGGGTLNLNDTTGEMLMSRGTIKNGTIAISGSGNLNPVSSGNILDNVTIEGELTMTTRDSAFELPNGLTLNGTILMQASSTRLVFSGDGALFDGTGTVKFMSINHSLLLFFEETGTKTLTIGSGITIEGGGLSIQGNDSQVVNQGAIRANVANRSIIVGVNSAFSPFTVTLQNQGVLEALDGGELIVFDLMGNLGNASIQGASDLTLDGAAYTINQNLTIPSGGSLTLNGGWDIQAQITNDGAFSFGGELTLAQLGSSVSGTGTVLLSGILDLEGDTLAIDDDFGTLILDGGTLKNGTIAFSESGSLSLSSGTNVFEDLILEGDSVIMGTAFVVIRNTLTVNGTIGMPFRLSMDGDVTMKGVGIARFEAINNTMPSIRTRSALTLTIGSDLTLEGELEIFGSNFWEMNLVNQGTIRSNVPNRKFILGANTTSHGGPYVTLDNQGVLEAVNGGTLDVRDIAGPVGSVTLLGASQMILAGTAYDIDQAITIPDTAQLTLDGGWNISVPVTNAGTLSIGGELILSEFGDWVDAGGSIELSGILDLETGLLVLDTAFGKLSLNGGTIKNGSIEISGSGNLVPVSGSQQNILDGITLVGDLSMSYPTLTFRNNLVLNGTLTVVGGGLFFGDNSTISGTGTLSLSGSASIGSENSVTPNTLTIGNDITLEGGPFRTEGDLSILNQGTIRSSVADQRVRLLSNNGYSFENQGTLEVLDGAILEIRSLTGSGVGIATLGIGAQLIVGYGDMTQTMLGDITNNGGNLELRGVLDLEAGTLNINDAIGEVLLTFGTIKNGTIVISGTGNLLPGGGALENVTLEGEMLMNEFGADLRIRDGLTLNGTIRLQSPAARLRFDGDETISGTGTISFETTTSTRTELKMSTAGELTIGSGITLEGGRVTIGATTPGRNEIMNLVNQGTIRANVADQTIIIEVTGGSFDNQGTLEQLNGGTIVQP